MDERELARHHTLSEADLAVSVRREVAEGRQQGGRRYHPQPAPLFIGVPRDTVRKVSHAPMAQPYGPLRRLFSAHFALLIAVKSTLGALLTPLFGQFLEGAFSEVRIAPVQHPPLLSVLQTRGGCVSASGFAMGLGRCAWRRRPRTNGHRWARTQHGGSDRGATRDGAPPIHQMHELTTHRRFVSPPRWARSRRSKQALLGQPSGDLKTLTWPKPAGFSRGRRLVALSVYS
jgi:hypothetical protein